MDDEPMLRETTVALLLRAGFRAEAVPDATSAEEAVRQAVAEGRPYAAALLDLTIPGGRGGIEAVGALAAIDPGLRAIVSSGYSHVPAMADPRAYGFVAALPKPYRLEDLVRVLRETIGSR
jgi:DNA-binding NtrC family response regulator